MTSDITVSGQLGRSDNPGEPALPITGEPTPHYTVQQIFYPSTGRLPDTGEIVQSGIFLMGLLCLILLLICHTRRKSKLSF